jgi:hypothetical protein
MPKYDVCAHLLSAVVPTVKIEDTVIVDVPLCACAEPLGFPSPRCHLVTSVRNMSIATMKTQTWRHSQTKLYCNRETLVWRQTQTKMCRIHGCPVTLEKQCESVTLLLGVIYIYKYKYIPIGMWENDIFRGYYAVQSDRLVGQFIILLWRRWQQVSPKHYSLFTTLQGATFHGL